MPASLVLSSVLTLWPVTSPLLAPPEVLPLERVRLYETGVGYFERGGRMDKGESLELPVPTAHLDDALKTLVVLSPGGQARVGGVAFESAVSEGAARAFAGLPEEGEGELGYDTVLRSLEGQRIEVARERGRDRDKVRGRLIQVEGPLERPQRVDADGQTLGSAEPRAPEWMLVVIGEDGDLIRIRTDEVASLRPLEEGIQSRIEIAAASLSGQRAQTPQALSLSVEKAGKIELGYVAESPIWRTSYRVVFDEQGSAVLQAWALVHNDTDEDWKRVDVELANGEPNSFLFPLAAPRYARRELIAPEVDLYTVPQLALRTPDSLWADGYGFDAAYGVGFGGAGGLGVVGHGTGGGYGRAEGTIGLGTMGSSLALGDLAEFAQADGSESEAQFVYKLEEPIDLSAHHSALVPLFAQAVDAMSITLFAEGDDAPAHALRLVNSTDKTLPAGTVALYADGGFSGEATLDRLKPGEPRYVVFGRDLDVELERTRNELGEERREVSYRGGTLRELYVERFEIELNLRNRSGRARKSYVALNLPRNADITTDLALDWDPERGEAMAVLEVDGRSHVSGVLTAGTVGHREHAVDGMTLAKFDELAKDRHLAEDVRNVLVRARAVQADVASAAEDLAEYETERAAKLEELERRRADLAAMGEGSAASRKTGSRIAELEAELDLLRGHAAKRSEEMEAARERRETILSELPN